MVLLALLENWVSPSRAAHAYSESLGSIGQECLWSHAKSACAALVVSCYSFVAVPLVPSILFLVVMPGATSSFLYIRIYTNILYARTCKGGFAHVSRVPET